MINFTISKSVPVPVMVTANRFRANAAARHNLQYPEKPRKLGGKLIDA